MNPHLVLGLSDVTSELKCRNTFHSVTQIDVLDVTSELKCLNTFHPVTQYNSLSCKDSYLLFRNKYLVSNVVNSRPEDARPLHSYKLKVQGTTIIGMLDSGAQLNCLSAYSTETQVSCISL